MFKSIKSKAAAAATALAGFAGSASAAVPTEVTTALTDAGTDTVTIGGAVLVIMIGISVFLWMRRAAK